MNHITSIGLDVHARSITAVALDSFTGEVNSKKFSYSPTEVASWILQFDSPKAVYGSGVTGQHHFIYDLHKRPVVANVATARELSCFIWELGRMSEGTL